MTALLEQWERCGDPRADFAGRWAATARQIAAAAHRGRFHQSDWILTLLDLLADYYLITVEPDDDDLTFVTAGAWRAAHEMARRRPSQSQRAVLLGFNALICNDLPQAIGDLLTSEWPPGVVRLERRRDDVFRVTDMIASTMGGYGRVVRAWSTDVWPRALALVTAVSDPWRDLIRQDIELTAARRAHLIACDIPGREALLSLPEHELDLHFPVCHLPAHCRLSEPLPSFGVPAPATS
ncbi:MAG: hypothetical protein JOZ75_02545 [Candidatus Dormibacteraeota bacterium]|nr:hypothetical protein [Candidatus Dormibacteraeota bacterium]